jgi:hypothetical protein
MKKLLVVVLALAWNSAHAQKWGSEFGLNYVFVKPVGGMGQIIAQGHGGSLNFGFVKPDGRLSLGLDMSVAQYGRDKSRQEYTLSDGTVAPMDIIVSNTFVNFMAYTRWYLGVEGVLRPYLTGKLGYSGFSTNLNIYDPDEFDHCEPVDSDVLYNDGTMIAVVGAGAKIDLASAFKQLPKGKFYFDGNVNFTQGGQVHYMNADGPTHHHSTTPDSDMVMAKFVNTQTQIVHEHHVGSLYSSAVQMTQVQVGFSMNISR